MRVPCVSDACCVWQNLECLSLTDSKLKADTAIIINALGGNTQLAELDIRLASRAATFSITCSLASKLDKSSLRNANLCTVYVVFSL